jgi:tyrosyl-tRNA synthetase
MSISDEMMWRYYELLTDIQAVEIEKIKREAHPMQAKKDLARWIVADFHSAEAAAKAGEDWAKQFQKDEVPGDVEEVLVKYADIAWSEEDLEVSPDGFVGFRAPGMGPVDLGIRLDRLLVKCGLADSATDAARKRKQGAVRRSEDIDVSDAVRKLEQGLVRVLDHVEKSPRILVRFHGSSARLMLRVGRRVKVAVIQR